MHAVRRSTKPDGARTVASTPGKMGVSERPGRTVRPERTESASQLDPLLGSVLSGRYRIQELIGSGGMGRVYRAIQEPLGRAVALKIVRDDESEDEEDIRAERRLRVEATILAQLQHPNIVTLHDFGPVDGAFHGRTFLAMELLDGRSLQDFLDLDRCIAPARVVAIAEQIVRALRFAHRRGIVHRDLKPSNVLLVRDADGDEIVKLVDFGIGKILGRGGAATKLTRTGAIMGTVGYISPEQITSDATPASDLFAVGVVMFECLTGKPPFDPASTVKKDGFAGPAPRIGEVAPELTLPAGLESLVAALLSRNPDERPTASEALRLLTDTRTTIEALPPVPSNVSVALPAVGVARAVSASHPAPHPAWMHAASRAAVCLIVVYAALLTIVFSRTKPSHGASATRDVAATSSPTNTTTNTTTMAFADPATASATPTAAPSTPAKAHAAQRAVPLLVPTSEPLSRPGSTPPSPKPNTAPGKRTVFSSITTED